jgi:hypothetical protein
MTEEESKIAVEARQAALAEKGLMGKPNGAEKPPKTKRMSITVDLTDAPAVFQLI